MTTQRLQKVVATLLIAMAIFVAIMFITDFTIRGERQLIAKRLCSVNEGAILSLPVEIKHRDVVSIGDALCSVPNYNVKPLNTALKAVFPEKPTPPPLNG